MLTMYKEIEISKKILAKNWKLKTKKSRSEY